MLKSISHCEARVGNFAGNIGELVKRYSSEFFPVTVGRADVLKYSLLQEERSGNYLWMVSKNDSPGKDYNVIISLFGPQEDRVKELMEEFQKRTNLETRPAPPFLQGMYQRLAELISHK